MTKENTKRIFLAATPDQHWQHKIAAIIPEVQNLDIPTVKFIPEDKYHITIHFWADVTLQQIKTIIDCTQNICQYFPAFAVSLTDLILFPNENKARVVAINIEQANVLQNFRDTLSQRFIDNGIDVERRSFRPHISVARIFQKLHLENPLLEGLFDAEPFYVEEVTLFESSLDKQGSIYSPLVKFELQ